MGSLWEPGPELGCLYVPTLPLSNTDLSPAFVTPVKSLVLGGRRKEAPEVSTCGALPLGIVFQLIKCEEEPATPKPKIELPERFRIRPVTPVENYIKVCKVFLSTCFPK